MKKLVFSFIIPGILILFILSCGSGKTTKIVLTDSLSIARGQVLFNQNCSGCHGFLQNGIGPNLSGITETDSADWLRQFIREPKKMVKSGDEHSKKIFDIYRTMMPSFTGIKDEQIDQLIAFLKTKKRTKKEKEDPFAIRDPIPEKIEASNIQIDLEQFSQLPPSSDKQPLTRISKMDWVSKEKTWFILDQRGKLYKLEDQKPVTWLDISKWKPNFINQPGLATGFGSFAFHPDYSRNGIFYTTHSEAAHSKKADFSIPDSIKQMLQWVLCEWKISDPAATVFKGTCRELMRIDMVSGIHGVQEIIFNPMAKPGDDDYGNLYIGVGDGGSAENGYSLLTHHPDKIWGSILRINPMGKNSTNGQYGIPKQNPFTKSPDNNTVREIYADGFRNPNRITWTRKGQMLATNIGQANIEAIDIILKGHDYGWPAREGRFAVHPEGDINKIYPLPANDSVFHFTYPIAAFDHDEGKAIEGGFEYEGIAIPELRGKYLFGDIPSGRLFYINLSDLNSGKLANVREWFVSMNGKRLTLQALCGQNRVDLRFARDEKGEMYIFTKPDGKIYLLKKISI
ncbi:MAG TPA: PQQ-dependent sugar dehydrogenase [Puia sp.]|jgi:cytochrome c2|nr:PQQ-dependent sugar dehydrogenase [Puia sp.]